MQGVCKARAMWINDSKASGVSPPYYLEAARRHGKGGDCWGCRNAGESRCLYDERNLSNIPLCPFFSDATSSFDAQHPLTPIVNHVFFLRWPSILLNTANQAANIPFQCRRYALLIRTSNYLQVSPCKRKKKDKSERMEKCTMTKNSDKWQLKKE